MLTKKKSLFIAVLWTTLITVLSLISISKDVGAEIKIENKDKIVHFLFYFVFVLLWYTYFKSNGFSVQKKLLIVLLIAVGYGILMELCQGVFTATRSPDIIDVLANSTGAFLGVVAIIISAKKNKPVI